MLSCKPQADAPYDLYNTQTLRASALQLADTTDWAFTETENKDTRERERFVRLPGGNSDNTAALFFADISFSEPVYPVIEGFSSLDTRMIPAAAYRLCENIIEGFKKKDLNADFFISGYEYLKVVYEYELRHLPDIKSGIIGKARVDEKGSFEIPLRLTTKSGFFNVFIYPVRENAKKKSSSAKSDFEVSGAEPTVNTNGLNAEVFKIEQIVFEELQK